MDSVSPYPKKLKGTWLFPGRKFLIRDPASINRLIFFKGTNYVALYQLKDRLCGLVVRVLGNRSGGPGSIPGITKKKVVGLERGSLSLVSITEELRDRKVKTPVQKTENTAVGIRHADHVAPFIRKKLALTSPTCGGRSVGIVRSRTQTMEFVLFVFAVPAE
jgi:hypothetical protein